MPLVTVSHRLTAHRRGVALNETHCYQTCSEHSTDAIHPSRCQRQLQSCSSSSMVSASARVAHTILSMDFTMQNHSQSFKTKPTLSRTMALWFPRIHVSVLKDAHKAPPDKQRFSPASTCLPCSVIT